MPEVRLRRALALNLVRAGRQSEAVAELQRALEIARELAAEQLQAECIADLGAVETELGRHEHARELLEEAAARFAELGDGEWRARALRNLAEVHLAVDGAPAAEALWHEASELLAGEPQKRAETQHRAAEAWLLEPGNEEQAERWLRAELVSAQGFEEGPPLAWRTAPAAALLGTHLPTEGAVALLGDSLAVYDDVGDERLASRVRIERAVVLSDLGRHGEAVTDLRWCLEVGERLNDRALRQHARANLGEAARRQGDLDAAESELLEALSLARELGDEEAIAHDLGNLGLTLSQLEYFDDAAAAYSEQLAIARRLRDPALQAVAIGGLGMLDFNAGRYGRAVSRYRRAAELQAGLSSLSEVEDLGGWLESLAAGGRFDELQATGQRLVDAAQAGGHEATAATAFARSGRHLLGAGELDGAAGMYGAAVRLRLTETLRGEDFDTDFVRGLAETTGLMAAHVETDVPVEERVGFYKRVLAELDRADEGLGDSIRPYLEKVRIEFDRMGVFERLRHDKEAPPDSGS
jgi:tetratricopeptide (TPR) repeat protein